MSSSEIKSLQKLVEHIRTTDAWKETKKTNRSQLIEIVDEAENAIKNSKNVVFDLEKSIQLNQNREKISHEIIKSFDYPSPLKNISQAVEIEDDYFERQASLQNESYGEAKIAIIFQSETEKPVTVFLENNGNAFIMREEKLREIYLNYNQKQRQQKAEAAFDSFYFEGKAENHESWYYNKNSMYCMVYVKQISNELISKTHDLKFTVEFEEGTSNITAIYATNANLEKIGFSL